MSEQKPWFNENVRLVRWRMTHEKLHFVDELRIIPGWLIGVAVALFVIGQVVAQIVHVYTLHKHEPLIAVIGVAAGAALVLDVFLLLYGYINRDAKRRGMNATLWTLLVILVPYLIGVIIYFLMREPLPYNCPQCGAALSARFNFCPSCKYNLRPACPHCRHEVRAGDKYCPHCAQELKGSTAA
jgi:hypothetical protein